MVTRNMSNLEIQARIASDRNFTKVGYAFAGAALFSLAAAATTLNKSEPTAPVKTGYQNEVSCKEVDGPVATKKELKALHRTALLPKRILKCTP